jgi:hypothetical protein
MGQMFQGALELSIIVMQLHCKRCDTFNVVMTSHLNFYDLGDHAY